jgi:hypothetical protein
MTANELAAKSGPWITALARCVEEGEDMGLVLQYLLLAAASMAANEQLAPKSGTWLLAHWRDVMAAHCTCCAQLHRRWPSSWRPRADIGCWLLALARCDGGAQHVLRAAASMPANELAVKSGYWVLALARCAGGAQGGAQHVLRAAASMPANELAAKSGRWVLSLARCVDVAGAEYVLRAAAYLTAKGLAVTGKGPS